jgi:hypothetical protein
MSGSNGVLIEGTPVRLSAPMRGAVVGEVARDDLRLAVLAAELPVLPGELDGGLHGVATAGREEHPVQVAGGVFGQSAGQGHGRFVGERPDREVGERLGLVAGGLGQLTAAVPDLHREQAGQPVEIALARLVVDVAALAAGDDRYVAGRVGAESGEVHPEMTLGVIGERCHDGSDSRRKLLRLS